MKICLGGPIMETLGEVLKSIEMKKMEKKKNIIELVPVDGVYVPVVSVSGDPVIKETSINRGVVRTISKGYLRGSYLRK